MPYADVLVKDAPPVPHDCPMCGTAAYTPIKEFPDGVVVGQCRQCDLIYTPLRHAAPASLFAGGSLELLQAFYAPILRGSKRHFRHRNYLDYLQRIARHAPGRRLLDVGCAHGFFLKLAKENGYQVMGVEPSPSRSMFAREALGLPVLHGCLRDVDLSGYRWDVVTFLDSLEYLPDPVADLSRVAERIVPGGILFLKVPNADYFRYRHALERRFRLRLGGGEPFGPSLRVVHYTRATLSRLLERVGLEVIETGVCSPVHSPPWESLVGLDLEIAPPLRIGLPERMLRASFHVLGLAEDAVCRRNHFSVSIYAVGRQSSGGGA